MGASSRASLQGEMAIFARRNGNSLSCIGVPYTYICENGEANPRVPRLPFCVRRRYKEVLLFNGLLRSQE